jgi:hypothetical protein
VIKLWAIPDSDSSGVAGGDACARTDARDNSRKDRENAAALNTLACTIFLHAPIHPAKRAVVYKVNRNNGGAWTQTGPNWGVFRRAAED